MERSAKAKSATSPVLVADAGGGLVEGSVAGGDGEGGATVRAALGQDVAIRW